MHIEPGVVQGAKIALSYLTAAGVGLYTIKLAKDTIVKDGLSALAVRSIIAAALVFSFFQVLPHYPVGVSEVHFIFGSTLFLMFGAAPAAIGLAAGLLVQGVFFAPFDLPQYGMNLTTILFPLFMVAAIGKKIIPEATAYKDISYKQAFALSTAYQGGVVAWVGFWAVYGNGFAVSNLVEIASFGAAYYAVVIVEPLLDLAILAAAKGMYQVVSDSKIFHQRLSHPVAE